MTDTITQLRVDHLHESPFNPRKIFDDVALQELAADIKAQGRILQPLLVRPRVGPLFAGDPDAAAGHEIVFGHRRFRAAELAGLVDVPCMVRSMSDEEARRAQISENLSRKDVHPIEEAEGFQALIDNDGETADAIAEKFGKSRSYVYGRLKLLEAAPAIRQACLSGEIGSETALLFSRQRPELQIKALEKMQGSSFYRERNALKNGGKDSYREIRDFLNEYFMLDLKGALWLLDDATLFPAAGPCTTCPKRSGCSPELFADVVVDDSSYRSKGGADVCTDPDCYGEKKKLQLKRQAIELEAKGQTVIAGGKARQILGADGSVKGGYVEASKVRKLIKDAKATVAIATAQNPRDGKTQQVVKIADLKAAGVKIAEPKAPTSSSRGSAHDWAAERKVKEAEAERKTKANVLLFKHVRNERHCSAFELDDVRAVANRLLEEVVYGDTDARPLLDVWDVKAPSDLVTLVAKLSGPDLTRFIMDCILLEHVTVTSWGLEEEPELLLAAAKRLGIDVDAVRADPDSLSTPPSAARAPEKAKAAPAGSKSKAKSKGKGKEQKDDAGVAGGSDGQVDAFAEVA